MLALSDMQKIGLGLLSIGAAFIFLGMLLFFDSGLLALGNLLFLSGIGIFIGPEKAFRLFFQWHKLKGTAFFFGGIVIVLVGFPIIGMLVESYGFFCLFSGFFPVIISFLSRLPVIGMILYLPGIRRITNYLAGESKSMA